MEQAAAAIAAQLNVAGSGKTKGFAGAGGRKLTVDVPAQDTSPAGTLQLAQDIVAALPKQLAKQFTVVHCGEGAPPAGGGGGAPVVSLQQCVAQGTDLTGCLLIAAPPASQVGGLSGVRSIAATHARCQVASPACCRNQLMASSLHCPTLSITLHHASPPQLDATMRLLAYWRGPAAVVLNAGWSMESLPIEQVCL